MKTYIEKVLDLVKSNPTLLSGVHLVEVRHDDWCPLLKGTGPCRCDAEIEIADLPEDDAA